MKSEEIYKSGELIEHLEKYILFFEKGKNKGYGNPL